MTHNYINSDSFDKDWNDAIKMNKTILVILLEVGMSSKKAKFKGYRVFIFSNFSYESIKKLLSYANDSNNVNIIILSLIKKP